ncbi:TFIIF-interacting CTD phosphatases, including NLI-interacting factor [Plasmopara halstedii]|uniref:RNA polymerase II subunit A C-terminal domain phosphatase n=1 Tax=Plasmopara halstedii TaxID=4781 RepID=A0A0P1B1U6_PLAHL|nr:TFIIF-interacting CTD phosphatases, including NLI-interacting factor [Plasmopara halstedii]CEG48676.1 TFIIF-interacting CTD phosphatases, including NLI-interacting factor [Plasmopara halstedii]|eukprot:XP_024585045.1 TFIIF-interacting CTD phosphatases, including NLI-interacting factor [Plasmopara halstedii]
MATNCSKREESASTKTEEVTDNAQAKVDVEKNKCCEKMEADDILVDNTDAETKTMKEETGSIKVEKSRIEAEAFVDGDKKPKNEEILKNKKKKLLKSTNKEQNTQRIDRNVKQDSVSRQQEREDDRSHIRRKSVSCDIDSWDLIKWDVNAGGEVYAGQKIGCAGRLEEGTQRLIQAPCNGRLYFLTKDQSDKFLINYDKAVETVRRTVAFVEYCVHPVRNGRTCLMCLAVVEDNEENEDTGSVSVVSHGQVIRLNAEEARKFDSDNIRRQLGAKKLSLVLDLDHTLLHAVRVDDVTEKIIQSDDIYFFFIPGLAQQHVVKLRPGLADFLTNLSALYDLFIYTHGTRLYAEQIVKIIDPHETYFKNRIVARTDIPDMPHKSLKLLFPSCNDSMILVLDDRIDVWKENEGNVFLIEPYHYFKCTSEINNASGQGLAGVKDSEAEDSEDRHLAQAATILQRVHEKFYAGHEEGMQGTTVEEQLASNSRDAKAILSAQKHAILQGLHIVFSGVFPIIGPQCYESHYLWRLAVDLGAIPSMTLTNFPLTHLVIHPERLGTQKYVQAKKIPGVFIVTPDWIVKCARSWSRVSEQGFLADKWKVKHMKTETEKLADHTSVTIPKGEFQSASFTDANDNTNGGQPSLAIRTNPDGQEKKIISTLCKGKGQDAKRSKQVSFANFMDDTARRPRSSVGHATGVVASGGTFDFLLKINATKREPCVSANTKKAEVAKTTPVCPAYPLKDMDDAFLRLMEAEELECEKEKRRKKISTNVKDQLVYRRINERKRSLESEATIKQPDEKRLKRVLSKTLDKEPGSLDEEEEELDDLEADILGNF